MMIRTRKPRFPKWVQDERGLTLVEVLATSLIFFAILIPLIGVYVKGVEIYQTTSLQNTLRNDTDFLIGSVMRTVQEASYVKLPSSDPESADDAAARQIIRASFPEFDDAASSNRLYVHKRSVQIQPASENTQTISLLTRETYSFAPCENQGSDIQPCSHIPFPVDRHLYLAKGFFAMPPQESGDAAKKQVILYLVVALRYGSFPLPATEEDKQNDALFANWAEVEKAVTQNTPKARYVRVVRTEIELGSEQKG
ncbi:PilW family protein [Brevibacillus sp. SAFN-007a]|uniref:PilW family protein n=1 Tax=Brevibacillus sp. SAFN-007a TaxID=3436862 RepID=UPI003F8114D6